MLHQVKLLRHFRKELSKLFKYQSTYVADTNNFAGSKTGTFVQPKPVLGNQYVDDPILKKYLQNTLPSEVFSKIQSDLLNFGLRVTTEIYKHHENVCQNEPVLEQYDAWGNRVDNIHMSPSWKALHDISANEGLIAIPYESKYGKWSRLYQASKLYLFAPSSGLFSCPLAMTDGAVYILKSRCNEPFASAYHNLISRDPSLFWTSGQWMTEKQGGSDVGDGAATVAKHCVDDQYKLYGYKWFTSATDSDMCITLARVIDSNDNATKGTKGLTMFYLPTRKNDGSLNGIRIEKLKKKLGTRQMPTAEIILDGALAYQLSELGRGIASISPMLTITRIHNAITAVSSMRRILNLSKDFAKKRYAFGATIDKHALHVQTLARMEVEQHGAFLLMMEVTRLFGCYENNEASDEDLLLLRILTPLLKLYTGKQAVSIASEGLESFGGHGYLEDTLIPTILRDAQVLSIWEGTTNILSLDVLRSILKSNGQVLKAFFEDAHKKLSYKSNETMVQTQSKLRKSLIKLQKFVSSLDMEDADMLSFAARDFAYSLSRCYIGCLLYEFDCKEETCHNMQLSFRWCAMNELTPVITNMEHGFYNKQASQNDYQLVFNDT